jgi:hypothetical protein
MLRRILLGLTILAAFTTVGVGVTDSAQAWGRWGGNRPYVTYYGGPPRAHYYDSYVPYRAYYGPRVYRPLYGRSYFGDPYYNGYHGPRSGISLSVGF